MTRGARIRVLVVDDSAFSRKVVREVLARDPEIEVVGIARDGLDALEKISLLSPDVVTLDLMMPDLDGLGVLRALAKTAAPRVIIVSASGAETDIALEALELGAVDVVTKPTALATDRLYELAAELVTKVKAVAAAQPRIRPASAKARSLALPVFASVPGAPRIVLVGTSTGGPQALTTLFSALPAGLPAAFAIALHIPAGYTAPLAARLSGLGGMPILEATDGMEVPLGHGVIAPGGMHLKLRRKDDRVFAVVTRQPSQTIHHPSVDVLFESAAEEFGDSVLGVIMTGMGNDGTQGSVRVRERRGRVITEAESSCIVYGMPRSVVEAGASNLAVPIEDMATAIVEALAAPSGAGPIPS